MYNTEVICTYHTDEVFLDTDNLQDYEKEFVRNAIYRQELLNILHMEDYNETEMASKIHSLYEIIKTNVEFEEVIELVAIKYINTDLEVGLMILFSYDYMHLTHACLCELFNTGSISRTTIQNLKYEI